MVTQLMPDATPQGPYRRFADEQGNEWLAWRLAKEDVDEIREAPSLGRAWLMFLAPNGETRRLAPVPTGWREMTEIQLHELALLALPFGKESSRL